MILFIKTHEGECAFVKAFDKNGIIYIDKAFIIASNCIFSAFKTILSEAEKIDVIQYDASVFVNDGFDLRRETDIPLLMYRNKHRFKDRMITEVVNIKDFIFRSTQSSDYSIFIDRFSSYQLQDEYNICVDILCDISKYYRIQKRLN